VRRFDLGGCTVGGCTGCLACVGVRGEPGCVIDDDAPAILEAMRNAEAIVLASPVYTWGVTGQLKALLDRGFCL